MHIYLIKTTIYAQEVMFPGKEHSGRKWAMNEAQQLVGRSRK